MRRRRSTLEAVCALSAALLVPLAASADTPALSAQLSCEPALGPGRVRCTLSASVADDQRIAWIDALVVSAPSFAQPLRSRIAHRGASEAARAEIALALLATRGGVGELVVRARAVVCGRTPADGRCRPLTRDASLKLSVGD